MDKKKLSERDICSKFINPALEQAGWTAHQIREEVTFTNGQIMVRGKLHTRGERKRADYVLYYKKNIPLAVIEAKDNNHSLGTGMQQALAYADCLQVPFVFLTSVIEHKRENYVQTAEDEKILQNSIYGIEKKPLPHLLCTTNMILHGIDVPVQIHRDNTLSYPLISWGTDKRVDVILTNPPFGGTEEQGIEKNFPSKFQTRETADLFMVLIIQLLKAHGRAAVVLPDGFMFGEGIKTAIKEKLMEDCNLHTIVRLPKSVFAPYTSISTNILFVTKGKKTEHVWFYEHQLPQGVKAYNKTKPLQLKEFDTLKSWWGKESDGFASRIANEQAWKVSLQDIIGRSYNLDIKNPHQVEEDVKDPKELLAKYESLEAEVAKIRQQLKAILDEALGQ